MTRDISVHDNLPKRKGFAFRACQKCLSDSRSVGKTYAFVRAIVDVRNPGCGNSLAVVPHTFFWRGGRGSW